MRTWPGGDKTEQAQDEARLGREMRLCFVSLQKPLALVSQAVVGEGELGVFGVYWEQTEWRCHACV